MNGHVGEIRTLVSVVLSQCLKMSCRKSCGLSWNLPVGLLFSAAAGLAAIVCKALLWEERRVVVEIAESPVDRVDLVSRARPLASDTTVDPPNQAVVAMAESPVDPVGLASLAGPLATETAVDPPNQAVVAMAESPVDSVGLAGPLASETAVDPQPTRRLGDRDRPKVSFVEN